MELDFRRMTYQGLCDMASNIHMQLRRLFTKLKREPKGLPLTYGLDVTFTR